MKYRIIYKYSTTYQTMRYVAQYKEWVFGTWYYISSHMNFEGAKAVVDRMKQGYQEEKVVWKSPY